MTTLLVTHPAGLDHITPAGHPERPDRLRAVNQALEDERFQPLLREQAPAATLEMIALCHPMDYVVEIRDVAPKQGLMHIDADTSMSPGTLGAVLRSVGGAAMAADAVMSGRADNAFVAMRPPGPPCRDQPADGLLLFRHRRDHRPPCQKRHGLARAAVVDFDVHHGNGTQDISGRTRR